MSETNRIQVTSSVDVSLRDRIAAALKTANDRVAGFIGYDEMADAVIRELDLTKACEGGCVWQIPNRFADMTDTQKQLLKPRLVADRDCTPLEWPDGWKADNE